MAKKVVIVESPSKSKTISKYLGDDYTVTASVGHIRDLATTGKGGLGIDVDNGFIPNYQVLPGKKSIVNDLNSIIKNAKEIYLATDPDREGEAISWHLYDALNVKGKEVKRVVFNEITKEAVTNAFLHPRDIDLNLVSSQETRRMLDRIIGFKLSMLLKSKIKSQSAGRVQSAALKLIVDLEKEINAFIPDEYYEISAQFGKVEAELFKLDGEKPEIKSDAQANKILENLDKLFKVQELSNKESKSYSKPALTTSSLQQAASNKYNYSAEKTMMIAQMLYEGLEYKGELVGLITYMRTDSTRLSEQFVSETKQYIKNTFGSKYVGFYREPKNKENAQDAHEAIRPTSVLRTPEEFKNYLESSDYEKILKSQKSNSRAANVTVSQLYKIYKLIYDKAVGSLMSASINEVTTLLLENNNTVFKASCSKPIFDGYLKLTKDYEEKEKKTSEISNFSVGDKVEADKIEKKQLFTTPPARYTEARLIKDMEELGIGRPSTYASTLSTLLKRKYVHVDERKLVPTDQGTMTTESLDQFFHEFISTSYSKRMEETLDEIALGNELQLNVLQDFYDYFEPLIEKAKKKMEKLKPVSTGEVCPKCGSPMVVKTGKFGQFEACSNFPKCKYIKPKERVKPQDTTVTCPECKTGTLVVKTASKGKSKGKKFLACSNFPDCRYISPLTIVDEECPDCNNVVVKDEFGEVRCITGKKCS